MALSPNEAYLLAVAVVFAPAYLIWRLGRTEYVAPLVVVQIVTGIALGPGVLGQWLPELHQQVFSPPVQLMLRGVAEWAIVLFLWTAGLELQLGHVWQQRRSTLTTAGLALGMPLLAATLVALALLDSPTWRGSAATPWQFALGIGMACSVTALPILLLFLEKLGILRQPLGQRILGYASLDDLLIWAVLAAVLMEVSLLGRQLSFLVGFGLASVLMRRLIVSVPLADRWYLALIWVPLCSVGADYAGLHYITGAFLSGLVLEAKWFDCAALNAFRSHLMLTLMPVFFLSTGLRTEWRAGGFSVAAVALLLLLVSVYGKLAGVKLAGHLLKWPRGEAAVVGWLLQTKALIVIIFANVLLDKHLITANMFAALLLMAVGSTVLTVPLATPALRRLTDSQPTPLRREA